MALGALEASDADISVATSGIAGPLGGSPEKPVGTVYIGVCIRDKSIGRLTKVSYKFHFEGDRAEVRKRTTEEALKIILSAF